MELIDLSMEIYSGMPVYHGLPEVDLTVHATHEEWEGLPNPKTSTPSVYKMVLSEHTGTHVDALNHMGMAFKDQPIDKMPLSSFYTKGICLDLSNKQPGDLISPSDMKSAVADSGYEILPGMTLLLYTDHYRKTYGTAEWPNCPGITAEAATWLGKQDIAAFGVESMSPGVPGVSNKAVHRICGELGFTHYENLINLHKLIGRGPFTFIGLPLKIRGGTGSPVRAVAVFENNM